MHKNHLFILTLHFCFWILFSGFLLFGFTQFSGNKDWFQRIPISQWKDLPFQLQKMGPRERRFDQYGPSFQHSMLIQNLFVQKNISDPYVLMPPKEYFSKRGISFEIPEPIIFYYYTGIKNTGPKSEKRKKANWYLALDSTRLTIDSIESEQKLNEVLKAFEQ